MVAVEDHLNQKIYIKGKRGRDVKFERQPTSSTFNKNLLEEAKDKSTDEVDGPVKISPAGNLTIEHLKKCEVDFIFEFGIFHQEGLQQDSDSVDETAIPVKICKSYYKYLLKNPLVEAFLHLKWQLIKPLFYLNVFCYGFFLMMLTILATIVNTMTECHKDGHNVSYN